MKQMLIGLVWLLFDARAAEPEANANAANVPPPPIEERVAARQLERLELDPHLIEPAYVPVVPDSGSTFELPIEHPDGHMVVSTVTAGISARPSGPRAWSITVLPGAVRTESLRFELIDPKGKPLAARQVDVFIGRLQHGVRWFDDAHSVPPHADGLIVTPTQAGWKNADVWTAVDPQRLFAELRIDLLDSAPAELPAKAVPGCLSTGLLVQAPLIHWAQPPSYNITVVREIHATLGPVPSVVFRVGGIGYVQAMARSLTVPTTAVVTCGAQFGPGKLPAVSLFGKRLTADLKAVAGIQVESSAPTMTAYDVGGTTQIRALVGARLGPLGWSSADDFSASSPPAVGNIETTGKVALRLGAAVRVGVDLEIAGINTSYNVVEAHGGMGPDYQGALGVPSAIDYRGPELALRLVAKGTRASFSTMITRWLGIEGPSLLPALDSQVVLADWTPRITSLSAIASTGNNVQVSGTVASPMLGLAGSRVEIYASLGSAPATLRGSLPVNGTAFGGALALSSGPGQYRLFARLRRATGLGARDPFNVGASTTSVVVSGNGCATVFNPASANNVPASGATLVVTITSPCASPAAANVPAWITATVLNANSLRLVIAANTGAARSATLQVANANYTVQQQGTTTVPPSCSVAGISPDPLNVGASGGSRSMTVTMAPLGCAVPVATSDQSWVRASNPNGANITLSIDPNPTTASRTANLRIASSRSVRIVQAGQSAPSATDCQAVTVSPTSLNLPAAAGSAGIQISLPATCATPTIGYSASWLRSVNAGPGGLVFGFDANPGPPRSAIIQIGSRSVGISQAPGSATVLPVISGLSRSSAEIDNDGVEISVFGSGLADAWFWVGREGQQLVGATHYGTVISRSANRIDFRFAIRPEYGEFRFAATPASQVGPPSQPASPRLTITLPQIGTLSSAGNCRRLLNCSPENGILATVTGPGQPFMAATVWSLRAPGSSTWQPIIGPALPQGGPIRYGPNAVLRIGGGLLPVTGVYGVKACNGPSCNETNLVVTF